MDLAGQTKEDTDTPPNREVRKIQSLHGYRCNNCNSTSVALKESTIFHYHKRYIECETCNSKQVQQTCPECTSTEFDVEEDYIINCRRCGLVIAIAPPLYVSGRRVRVDNILLKRKLTL